MKLTIGTYNIQHARHYGHYLATGEEIRSISEIAEVIRTEGMDICGLQEVFLNDHTKACVEGVPRHQARGIAELLGYSYAFGLAHDRALHKDGGYGVAIVSRYPIVGKRTVAIPAPEPPERKYTGYYEDRVLLIAEIEIGGRILTVINTHYGLNPDELERAVVLTERELRHIDTPVLLMGDLNMTAENPLYERLAAVLRDTTHDPMVPLTFPSNTPRTKIDFIFASEELSTADPRVPETLISDHSPYLIDMEW
ncbi:MAG: hypothetical protein E7668_06825 [Ruminococcaceae bacterium]|nr:hypothetical protein [Oscillospiraceae bacterium]